MKRLILVLGLALGLTSLASAADLIQDGKYDNETSVQCGGEFINGDDGSVVWQFLALGYACQSKWQSFELTLGESGAAYQTAVQKRSNGSYYIIRFIPFTSDRFKMLFLEYKNGKWVEGELIIYKLIN